MLPFKVVVCWRQCTVDSHKCSYKFDVIQMVPWVLVEGRLQFESRSSVKIISFYIPIWLDVGLNCYLWKLSIMNIYKVSYVHYSSVCCNLTLHNSVIAVNIWLYTGIKAGVDMSNEWPMSHDFMASISPKIHNLKKKKWMNHLPDCCCLLLWIHYSHCKCKVSCSVSCSRARWQEKSGNEPETKTVKLWDIKQKQWPERG